MKNNDELLAYERLIREWQKKFNLVSRGDLEKIWVRHIGDSLKIYEIFPQLSFQNVIDVGSGAGFPGIPMSILRPQVQFTLMEATAKKCAFLHAAIAELPLRNVTVVNGRAEDLGREEIHREKHDLALTRALAHPHSALELVLPFARVGGACVFWGSGPDWENKSRIDKIANILGGTLAQAKSYYLEGDPRERKLFLVEKKIPRPQSIPGGRGFLKKIRSNKIRRRT